MSSLTPKNKSPISSRILINLYKLRRHLYTSRSTFLRKFVSKFFSAIDQIFIQTAFHSIISKEADIGKNLILPHPFGIFIAPDAKLGSNVTIMPFATIGRNELLDTSYETIYIGDDVYIGAGARILSNGLTIGEGAIIGPNALVVKDVPPHAVMMGVPARNIRRRKAP
jgi:serine O-acetyltransferase